MTTNIIINMLTERMIMVGLRHIIHNKEMSKELIQSIDENEGNI